jgi:hypothetical protein
MNTLMPELDTVGIAHTVALTARVQFPAVAFSLFSCFVVSVYAVVFLCFVSSILFIVPCILSVVLVLYWEIL